MADALLQTSPRYSPVLPIPANQTPTTSPHIDFETLPSRLLATPRNPSTPLLGFPISVGEGDTSSSKCITQMDALSDILVSDRLRDSPNRMDIDTRRYHNLCADDMVPTRPSTSAMPIYSPTQITTRPQHEKLEPGPFPSPVLFNLVPSAPTIAPPADITIPVGQEMTLFHKLCGTLDMALDEWDRSVPDDDKESCPDSTAVILNIQDLYVSEKLIFGKRVGKNEYWEGQIELTPGDTRVCKLKTGRSGACFYGVWVGLIRDFWDFYDGAHVFYGQDKKMYCHPGSN
jgi:hypothetical protein